MVFQNYALFPHLNVFDNVAFGLRRHHVPGEDVRRRAGAALELVHLTGYDRRRPDQLSGGQQQRVALARALVNEPTVLLLDEPLGALDLKLRKQLQVELKRVQLQVGITFIYVTHDQEEALTLSDRIAVMDRGRVEQLGTPEELYERPRTRFVADFIGTTNLLAGTVESVDGDIAVVDLGGVDRCAVGRGGLQPGQLIELSIRPEVVELSPVDPAGVASPGAAPTLRGRIEQSAYLGTSVSHLVRTDGGRLVATVVPKTADRLATGQSVELRWRPSDVLILSEPHDPAALHEEEARL
jgi:spermidine/putrescine transport system ATP-binding protein